MFRVVFPFSQSDGRKEAMKFLLRSCTYLSYIHRTAMTEQWLLLSHAHKRIKLKCSPYSFIFDCSRNRMSCRMRMCIGVFHWTAYCCWSFLRCVRLEIYSTEKRTIYLSKFVGKFRMVSFVNNFINISFIDAISSKIIEMYNKETSIYLNTHRLWIRTLKCRWKNGGRENIILSRAPLQERILDCAVQRSYAMHSLWFGFLAFHINISVCLHLACSLRILAIIFQCLFCCCWYCCCCIQTKSYECECEKEAII